MKTQSMKQQEVDYIDWLEWEHNNAYNTNRPQAAEAYDLAIKKFAEIFNIELSPQVTVYPGRKP